MNIQIKCTLFLILTITTVLCELKQDNKYIQDVTIKNDNLRRIRSTNETSDLSENSKIPGVISLDISSEENNNFPGKNLTSTSVPKILTAAKFSKKLSLKQINESPKINSSYDKNSKNEDLTPPVKNITNDEIVGNFSRARALDIPSSPLEPTNSLGNLTDLSDVSMDENDKQIEGGEYIVHHNESNFKISPLVFSSEPKCTEPNNKTYSVGEVIVRGCTEKCICSKNGTADNCQPICETPLVRAIGKSQDPYCYKQKVDDNECCAILVCSSINNSNYQSPDTCNFVGTDNINKTIAVGQHIEDGCTRICTCQPGGVLNCKPRCSSDNDVGKSKSDRCVKIEDPKDSCCTITYCDVSIGEHELPDLSSVTTVKPIINEEIPSHSYLNNDQIKVINSSTIKILLPEEMINVNKTIVEVSKNNHIWKRRNLNKEGIISNLEPSSIYYIRIKTEDKNNQTRSTVGVVSLPSALPPQTSSSISKNKSNLTSTKLDSKDSCTYRGKLYEIGAEWYDECINFCVCEKGPKTQCVTIECPTDFGLDVLDPSCLDWETVPLNFVAKAPQCCPEEVRCRNNGSCTYEGVIYDNWSEIPNNVTGCDKRCYCEMGKVSCQPACPPVPALPPDNLSCASNQAILTKLPDDECCMHWVCNSEGHNHHYMPEINSTVFVDEKLSPLNTNIVANGMKKDWQSIKHTDMNNNYQYGSNNSEINNSNSSDKPVKVFDQYNGPYNPNYKLPGQNFDSNNNNHVKDKFSKSKLSETKKVIEPTKSYHKITDAINQFPGPLAPDRLPTLGSKDFISNPADNKTQFYQNGDKISSSKINKNKFEGFKQVTPSHDYSLLESSTKPEIPEKVKPEKSKFPQVKDKDKIPDELLHLINLHHPELIQDSGLHEYYPEKTLSVDEQPPPIQNNNHRVPQLPVKQHIGVSLPSLLSQQDIDKNKYLKPQIKAQKNENGEITSYHIHSPQFPTSPKQIEELLAHISHHDAFHNYPTSSPSLPLSSPSSAPSSPSLLTHLNHPFAGIQGPKTDLPDNSGHIYSSLDFPLHGDSIAANEYFNKVTGQLSSSNNEIIIKALDAIDDSTIRILFTVPPALVGLYGRVELRYTNEITNSDPSTWRSQIFIPPNDLIATPQLEFELDGLEPASEYKLKVTVNLRNDQAINNNPSSKVYSVKTLSRYPERDTLIKATTSSTTEITLPPQILIDAGLKVIETNFSWIKVEWKKFSEFEIQFIDGIQLRYKEYDSKVYTTTPLIHRAVTSWIIEGLKPATIYQVGISIIPFPGQTTELYSEKTIQITTSIEPDPYSFDVKVEIKMIKSQEVELSWSGVPYPEDKYVNIYRAIYQSDSGKGDTSTFKIAKRDSPAKTIISDLKPGTRYRLWLEIYLTNGKIKKSNVQDFITKPGVDLHTASSGNIYQPGKYGITASAAAVSIPSSHQEINNINNNSSNNNNYYGPLVIVAIVASLAILSTLILLMMLMKRRSSNKADISSARKTNSSAAYDNPSYKVEIQQETMDL